MINSKTDIWDRKTPPPGELTRTTAWGHGQPLWLCLPLHQVAVQAELWDTRPTLLPGESSALCFSNCDFSSFKTLSAFLLLENAVRRNGWTGCNWQAFLACLPDLSQSDPSNTVPLKSCPRCWLFVPYKPLSFCPIFLCLTHPLLYSCPIQITFPFPHLPVPYLIPFSIHLMWVHSRTPAFGYLVYAWDNIALLWMLICVVLLQIGKFIEARVISRFCNVVPKTRHRRKLVMFAEGLKGGPTGITMWFTNISQPWHFNSSFCLGPFQELPGLLAFLTSTQQVPAVPFPMWQPAMFQRLCQKSPMGVFKGRGMTA